MDVFLLHNDHEIVAAEEEARRVVEGTAAGDLDEKALRQWLEDVIEPVDTNG